MKDIKRLLRIEVSADGDGVVSHAGSRLLSELAEELGLTGALSKAMSPTRKRRSGHDRGKVLIDLAVMLADGGDSMSDLAVLRDQSELFGQVASDPTAWRVVDSIDSDLLATIEKARAEIRARAWRAGVTPDWIVLDLDATLVDSHSEKENAAPTYKRGFGFHPMVLPGLNRRGSGRCTEGGKRRIGHRLSRRKDSHRIRSQPLLFAPAKGENQVVEAEAVTLHRARLEVQVFDVKTDHLEGDLLYPLKAAFLVAIGRGLNPLMALKLGEPPLSTSITSRTVAGDGSMRSMYRWSALSSATPLCGAATLFRAGDARALFSRTFGTKPSDVYISKRLLPFPS